MAKERTVREIEREMGDLEESMNVEEVIYTMEDVVDTLGGMARELPKAEKDDIATLKAMEKTLKPMLTKYRRINKAFDKKYDKLEAELREARAKGCDHDHIKCADCGQPVKKK